MFFSDGVVGWFLGVSGCVCPAQAFHLGSGFLSDPIRVLVLIRSWWSYRPTVSSSGWVFNLWFEVLCFWVVDVFTSAASLGCLCESRSLWDVLEH